MRCLVVPVNSGNYKAHYNRTLSPPSLSLSIHGSILHNFGSRNIHKTQLEMGGTCSTQSGDGKCMENLSKNRKGREFGTPRRR